MSGDTGVEDEDLEGPGGSGFVKERVEEPKEVKCFEDIQVIVRKYICQKCGYEWIGNRERRPTRCPRGKEGKARGCGNPTWWKPKKYTWRPKTERELEKDRRKAKRAEKLEQRRRDIEAFKQARKDIERLAKRVLK
jgi:hypothetical protein